MLPYYLIFGLLVLLGIFEIFPTNKKIKLISIVIAGSALICMAGFRADKVGLDYENYSTMFLYSRDFFRWFDTGSFGFADYMLHEPVFVFLITLSKSFSNSPVILFFVTAFLSVFISCIGYSKLSPYPILSLILYYSHTFLGREMVQIRSGLAASVLLFAIPFVTQKKPWKFLGTVLFATLCHNSALFFIFVYPITHLIKDNRIWICLIIAAMLFAQFNLLDPLFTTIIKEGYAPSKIESYYQIRKYSADIGIFDITNIKQMVLALFFMSQRKRLKEAFVHADTIFIFYMIATTWRIAFSDFSIFAGRIATFFSISEVILIPMVVVISKPRTLMYGLFVIFALLTLFLNLHVRGVLGPYRLVVEPL